MEAPEVTWLAWLAIPIVGGLYVVGYLAGRRHPGP
jgi:hypothetical protein